MGLKPGNPDGTFIQNVPLAGIISKPQMTIAVKGKKLALDNLKDYIAVSQHYQPEVSVDNAGIVFVGYGVVAPEYGWDDYKDVDVKGKTILMLVNDPQIPDPKDPAKLDNSMFKGNAMILTTGAGPISTKSPPPKAPPPLLSFTKQQRPVILLKSFPGAGAVRISQSSVPTITPTLYLFNPGSLTPGPTNFAEWQA